MCNDLKNGTVSLTPIIFSISTQHFIAAGREGLLTLFIIIGAAMIAGVIIGGICLYNLYKRPNGDAADGMDILGVIVGGLFLFAGLYVIGIFSGFC